MLPSRKKRNESYLGIHFDFHAGKTNINIGANTTPEMIESIINQVHPDYIQCDCKGHPGLSSYPTAVGNPAPGIVKDALKVWREVAAKKGVSLYMHYSGVWDTAAIESHPEWASIQADGTPHKDATSVFGEYADKLLIPQLKELCDVYGVDGVWIDGDAWAVANDYCYEVKRLYNEKTGKSELPKSPDEDGYHEFLEINREGYRQYVRKLTNAMKTHNHDFEVCCNWAFSSVMPEPVSADISFLSGDYTWTSSVNSARFEGRVLARQGKPWDLMAWGFTSTFEDFAWSNKTPPQLCREAAMVLSLGGGFQAYFTQKPDGSVKPKQLQSMSAAAEFCREREIYCHNAELVPQIAVLFSTDGFYSRLKNRCFAAYGGEIEFLKGMLYGLLDNQYSTELLMEHHLSGRLNQYPLVVVPEWEYISPSFLAELKAYVHNGGKLIVTGGAVKHFEEELQIKIDTVEDKTTWVESNGYLAGIKCPITHVTPNGAAEAARFYDLGDIDAPCGTSAATSTYGKGSITGIFFNYGLRYLTGRSNALRGYLNNLVKTLFPDPMVTVTGSAFVDVIITNNHDKLMINLINMEGSHEFKDIYTVGEIVPIGPLCIKITLPEKPKKIISAPQGKELSFTYANGKAELVIDRLELHDILVIEQ